MDAEKAQATAGRKLIVEARMRDHYLDSKGKPVWHKLAHFKRDDKGNVIEEDGKRTLIGGEKYFGGAGATIILNFQSWSQLPDGERAARFVDDWLHNRANKQNEVEIRRRYIDVTLVNFLSDPRIPMSDVAGDSATPVKERKKPGPKPKAKGDQIAEAR